MQHVENELDITLEKLTQTATKLDEKLKAYALAEGEIQALKRKISLLEDELERSESKGTITTKELSEASALKDSIDKALKTLETKNMIDEQRVIGENLKALEVAEEKAQQREEEYKKQIKVLLDRLKNAEARAEYGEKTVQKLNLRIDSIMADLVTEKMKTQNVNDEVDQTFELFVNH